MWDICRRGKESAMELHELVERIQQWKTRQAAERGEEVAPVRGFESGAVAAESFDAAPTSDIEDSAVEEIVESVDEMDATEADTEQLMVDPAPVEPEMIEAAVAADIEAIEPEQVDEPEDATSEVDIEDIEAVEET
jgi:hypothetical protein